jgi:hypothetical protein
VRPCGKNSAYAIDTIGDRWTQAFCDYTVKRVEHESPLGRTATPEEIAGRQLALLREERGWSQSEVARRMEAYGQYH